MTLKDRCCDCSFWIKYSLFLINFMVWIGGISLMIIGVWARLEKAELGAVGDLTTDPAIFLIAIGVIMFIISFFGCIGSLRENLQLLKIYCGIIVVVFILEVVCGVLTLVFINRVKLHMTDYMIDAISSYQDNPDLRNVVDYVQKTFKCCGASSFRDWDYNLYYNCSSPSQLECSVPPSCCKHSTDILCGQQVRGYGDIHAAGRIHLTGCVDSLFKLFKDNLIIIGVLAFGVCFVELFAIILAIFFMKIITMCQREQLETAHLYTARQTSYDTLSTTKINN